MSTRQTVKLIVAGLFLAGSLAACGKKEEEGPAQRIGKQLDQAVEKAGQEMEKAGEKLKDAGK